MTPTPLLPGMRRFLYVACGLVLLAGGDLFIFTEQTDRLFGWTIASRMSASFLGAAYLSASVVEYQAARQKVWANARLGFVAVLVFTTLTLIVTLLHIGQFHFSSSHFLARLAAWFWLFIYVSVPLVMLALLRRQLRQPRHDPPRALPVPRPTLMMLGVQGATMLIIGSLLLLAPDTAAEFWPWPLTDLTARAIGAWLVAIGAAAGHALIERDAARLSVGILTYTVFGALELVNLARYGSEVHWGSPSTWVYLGFVVTILVFGAGSLVSIRTRTSERSLSLSDKRIRR
jgi:hypothetical protein